MTNYCYNCINYPGKDKLCPKSKRQLNKAIDLSCGLFTQHITEEVEMIQPGEALFPDLKTVELLIKEPNGRIHVLDRQPKDSPEGINLVIEAIKLKQENGRDCPYSFRYVE